MQRGDPLRFAQKFRKMHSAIIREIRFSRIWVSVIIEGGSLLGIPRYHDSECAAVFTTRDIELFAPLTIVRDPKKYAIRTI